MAVDNNSLMLPLLARRAVKLARQGRYLRNRAEALAGDFTRYGLSWRPDSGEFVLYGSGPELEKLAQQLREVTGMEVEEQPPQAELDCQSEVLLKEGIWPLRWMGVVSEALGGPSAVTDAIAGALVTGGLGYGVGTLLENLFPRKYVRRGRLRRSLGLTGMLLGAVPGIWLGVNHTLYGKNTSLGDAWFKRHQDIEEKPFQEYPAPEQLQKESKLRQRWLEVPEELRSQIRPLLKRAQTGVWERPVPVRPLQQAIWSDVAQYGQYGPPHTPPSMGATASAIVSDVQQRYGNRSILSPRHFVRGLVAAGADLATSKLVGGVLSALGGLTPAGQRKLQEMGLWGGMIRGMFGSLLGF